MASPVTPSQVQALIPSPTSSICARVRAALVLLPQKLYELVNYMFDSTGAPTNQFARDITSGLLPAGSVVGWLSDILPTGWLRCDGSPISRSTYAALFSVVGTRYGVGDGATTFNLPDFRGRVLAGAGQGDSLSLRSLGDEFGEETHKLTVDEMPSHVHDINGYGLDGVNQPVQIVVDDDVQTNEPAKQTSSVGGDIAHENCQPSGVVVWIIRT